MVILFLGGYISKRLLGIEARRPPKREAPPATGGKGGGGNPPTASIELPPELEPDDEESNPIRSKSNNVGSTTVAGFIIIGGKPDVAPLTTWILLLLECKVDPASGKSGAAL